MSTTVIEKSEPIISKKDVKAFTEPIWDNNPVTLQILGICSSLAVTTQMNTSMVMAISVTVVTAFSNLVISLMRNLIPSKIRIIVMLTIVSVLVILVDQFLQAYMYDMSKKLSVFVGLIITNCILLGRAEGYAYHNKPLPSFLDGIGNGVGYGAVLLIVGAIREIFGNGTFFGGKVIPDELYAIGYKNIGLMILPPGAFIILGSLIWIQRSISRKFEA